MSSFAPSYADATVPSVTETPPPPPAPAYVAPAVPLGPVGKVRGTGLCILLAFVTLGIYVLVWYYMTHEEMKRHGAWRGGECWFDLDAGSAQASIGTVPTRVVAQAYSTFCLMGSCSTTYQSVKINAYESM